MNDGKFFIHPPTIMGFIVKKYYISKRSFIYLSPDIRPPTKKQILGCKVIFVNPSREDISRRV